MYGLSIIVELLNGAPSSSKTDEISGKPILHYWQLTVVSNGTIFPQGIVTKRFIFALAGLRWKEDVQIPFASADGYDGIVDGQSELIAAEIHKTEQGKKLVVSFAHPMKDIAVALPLSNKSPRS
jgi:hypothetical protein